ncbi:endoribonuclease L-PSP [Bacillus sp. UMTAT18]|nr:endoribonuclease L-PSP [Bacillus sp. UMTAT18]
MQKKFINPETMPPTFGYSHVVEVSNAKRTIYISEQVAIDIDGQIVGINDLATQTRLEIFEINTLTLIIHQQVQLSKLES